MSYITDEQRRSFPLLEGEITRRWEEGIEHDTRSEILYTWIETLDWEIGGDFFCFKHGGDGDNGEHLMYLLDVLFQLQDEGLACLPDLRQSKDTTG